MINAIIQFFIAAVSLIVGVAVYQMHKPLGILFLIPTLVALSGGLFIWRVERGIEGDE